MIYQTELEVKFLGEDKTLYNPDWCEKGFPRSGKVMRRKDNSDRRLEAKLS